MKNFIFIRFFLSQTDGVFAPRNVGSAFEVLIFHALYLKFQSVFDIGVQPRFFHSRWRYFGSSVLFRRGIPARLQGASGVVVRDRRCPGQRTFRLRFGCAEIRFISQCNFRTFDCISSQFLSRIMSRDMYDKTYICSIEAYPCVRLHDGEVEIFVVIVGKFGRGK